MILFPKQNNASNMPRQGWIEKWKKIMMEAEQWKRADLALYNIAHENYVPNKSSQFKLAASALECSAVSFLLFAGAMACLFSLLK